MRTRSANGVRSSWYLDADGRNATIWPDFTWRFWQQTRQFDEPAYRFAHGTGRAQRCRGDGPLGVRASPDGPAATSSGGRREAAPTPGLASRSVPGYVSAGERPGACHVRQ